MSFVSTDTGGEGKGGSSLHPQIRPSDHPLHPSSPEESSLLSPDSCQYRVYHDDDYENRGSCVKKERNEKERTGSPTTTTRRWSGSGSRNRVNRRLSSRRSIAGVIDVQSLKSGTRFLLAVDNWIRSKVSMRIRRIVSSKRGSHSEMTGMDSSSCSNGVPEDGTACDSCPRLLLLRRHHDEDECNLTNERKSFPSGGVYNMMSDVSDEQQTTQVPAAKHETDRQSSSSSPAAAKAHPVDGGNDEREMRTEQRMKILCAPAHHPLSHSHPHRVSSLNPAHDDHPPPPPPSKCRTTTIINLAADNRGRGGDKDEEQGPAIDGKTKTKKLLLQQQKAKERKDVNGNFSHQVIQSGSQSNVTVNRKSILQLNNNTAASSPTSLFFDNPVCESVILKEQQQEQENEDRIRKQRKQSQSSSEAAVVSISCISHRVVSKNPLPSPDQPSSSSVTCRSWSMAGHESGGSDQTHSAGLQIESGAAGKAAASGHAATGQELLDVARCETLCRLPPQPQPGHEFKFAVPATNPAFIRPSTSTSINSIVIEASISDNESIDECHPDDRNGKIAQERRKNKLSSKASISSSCRLAESETTWSVIKELILAFLLAGLGNVAASYWLAKVQSWSVFKNIPQLVILVPPLIGLKGNVEMTLASRLSTHANLGDMDTKSSRRTILMGNMALIQCQASTVGFIAPIIALGLSLMSERGRYLRWREVVLLVASSVITANVANLILGSLMCGVILAARKYHINPDNIATPIAASLGDVTTMILLANISHFLYVSLDTNQWVQNTLLAFLMSLIPIWAYIARNNPYTRKVILNGWYPVCGAMLIQNAGGLVMERALKTFERIANLQLLINGVGGNLVAIQSSRMSTYLHKYSEPKELPKTDPSSCTYPGSAFISKRSVHTKMARILICLAVPSHLMFLLVTEFVNKKFFLTGPFIMIYLLIGVIHVSLLLQVAYNFVHWLWLVGVNPDNTAIPFLTAFADLVGSVLLFTSFVLLYLTGDPNAYDPNRAVNATMSSLHAG